MRQILYLFLFVIFIALFSCGRNDSYTSDTINIEPIKIQYFSKSSVLGQVLDQDLNPLPNSSVKYTDYNNNLLSTQTDENGLFKLKNKFLNENGQILSFDKAGYFMQYAFLEPSTNQLSFASIVQQLKDGARIIDAKIKNKEFFHNNIIECDLPANSITNKNKKSYSGLFNFYCKSPFLNPNTICYPDFGIPYSNIGINLEGQSTIVFPLFSTLIHIDDENENQLFFGDSITIKIKKDKVPCLGSDKFILWLFNPRSGKWLSQYEITSTSDILEFKIIESGYYIITDKTDVILNIEGQLLYSDLSPAENVYIEVLEPETGLLLGQYYSDNFGSFSIFKEEDTDVLLRIPKCDNSSYEVKIIENDDNIGEVSLPADFNNKYELEIMSPVPKGFLVVEENTGYGFSSKLSIPIADSSYTDIKFHGCDYEYITLYDLDDLPRVKSSTPVHLYPGIQINQNDLIPTDDALGYFYTNINNDEEEIFNTYNYIYKDDDIITIESISSKAIAAIRFNDTESICHFSYIKFIDKNDFDILETQKDSPLNFEILTNTSQELIGHFHGNIDFKGESKKIDGYFKIPN